MDTKIVYEVTILITNISHVSKSLLIAKRIINDMRTTIPAKKKDVAMATSRTLNDASAIWRESPAK